MATDLVQHLSSVVASLSEARDAVTPEKVVEVAALALPHGRHAGLTLLRPNRPPVTAAASDPLPREVDELEYSLGEGPCLDAATGAPVLVSDDIAIDGRWPRFGPRCAETTGVRGMLSLRLPVGGQDHAAINYYSTDVEAFTDSDIAVASIVVPLAALAIEASLRAVDHENLVRALASSREISTAVGILMAKHGLVSDAAFELLRRASMDLNIKLRDVADMVNLTGSLPAPRSVASKG